MQKTKLGISVGLLGAITYLCCLVGGYTPVIILVGYIALFEENIWLKKTAIKAFALMLAFSLISIVFNLIPGAVNLINELLGIFDEGFAHEDFYRTVMNIVSFVNQALAILEKVVFVLLGAKALTQGTITIPVIDTFIKKYMD